VPRVAETRPPHRRLRRVGFGLLAVAIGLGGVVLLLLFFQGRDSSQVHHDASPLAGPGLLLPADGGAAVAPGAVRVDGMRLSGAQLQRTLDLGNVALLYGTAAPPPALRMLARQIAGSFDPALEASGQAIVLARRPGLKGVLALAWRHALQVPDSSKPALGRFADFWLGRHAG
jgi:hypothetical protein